MGLFGKKKTQKKSGSGLIKRDRKSSMAGKTKRILLAEEDFGRRRAFYELLSKYGECDVTVDGRQAVEYFTAALENKEPYDLACLSEWTPVMDGYQVLKKIREIESERNIPQENRIKVIMTSKQETDNAPQKAEEADGEMLLIKSLDEEKFQAAWKELGLA